MKETSYADKWMRAQIVTTSTSSVIEDMSQMKASNQIICENEEET